MTTANLVGAVTTTPTAPKHPAKFSDSILDVLDGVMAAEAERKNARLRVLDPMAGTGRIHELDRCSVYETRGVELESEWAAMHRNTIQGDATRLGAPDDTFDVVCTSPAYGNRMADHHNAKDIDPKTGKLSKRMTYKHQLGRDLSPNSGAGLQWGLEYKRLHNAILIEMVRVTKPGGLVVVNVSNFYKTLKRGEPPVEQLVSEWWLGQMLHAGLTPVESIPVHTPRMGFGANRNVRAECEWVFVTRKP